MKVSEAIGALIRIIVEHGDLEVVSVEPHGEVFAVYGDKVFEAIDIPVEGSPDYPVCAFISPDPEPPTLSVVKPEGDPDGAA